MIEITKSETADTRTCDWSKVGKETLKNASEDHIEDVRLGLEHLMDLITEASDQHDFDKLTDIDGFHRDFKTGFKQTEWWDKHRKINRHHIDKPDGVPNDVNLIDVLEHITDCVMAGMARSGSVYKLKLDDELLQTAFQNTGKLLKEQVVVVEEVDQQKEGED